MQFVSANGPNFVDANSWVKDLLFSRQAMALPSDVRLYIFATQTRAMRTSGVSGHVRADKRDYRVVSEFTFWPLGSVLSYSDLSDEPLLEISDWSRRPFRSKGSLDMTLPVNPADSDYPVNFRDNLDIYLDTLKKASALPEEELVLRMQAEVKRRSGNSLRQSILTAAPSTVELAVQRGSAG